MAGDIVQQGTELPPIGKSLSDVRYRLCSLPRLRCGGQGDWQVAVLMRLGWTYEEAMIVIARVTGQNGDGPCGVMVWRYS